MIPTPHYRRRMTRGVTLIEAILVITLLSAAVVAGSFAFRSDWVTKRSVTAVTSEVAEMLNTARNTAIMNRANVTIAHGSSGTATLLVITEEAGPIRSGKSWTVDLGSDARITGSPRQIVFNPAGSADRMLEWKISRDRTSGSVSVSPTTGIVKRILP